MVAERENGAVTERGEREPREQTIVQEVVVFHGPTLRPVRGLSTGRSGCTVL